MRHLWWVVVAVAAFLLGIAVGRSTDPTQPAGGSTATAQDAAPADLLAPATDREAAPGDFQRSLEEVDQLRRGGRRDASAALAARLLTDVARQARHGDVAGARQRLVVYLRHDPHDPQAYLLEADLWQMQDQDERALESLLTLLTFADTPEMVARARDKLRVLIDVQVSQLAARDDVAGLIRLFDRLSAGDPQFDGHRLQLARWLLRAGRLDDAAGVLAQTGTVGIDPASREDLVAALALAREGLPLERDTRGAGPPNALHVQARVAGKPVRLLVDTGATTTAISRARADALNARPTGERVRVHTANGVVQAEVRRLSDVRVGALRLPTLDVIVLEQPLPDAVDGLLGMDVLARFPGVAGSGVIAP
jgi:clan AA aspartic protease (TIGR02281 family)